MSDDLSTITPTGLADFDAGRYLPELSDLPISEDQKREFLAALWSIMEACVELGFKVDVLDLVCGQCCEKCGPEDSAVVD